MDIQYILGRAGTGKFTYCVNEILNNFNSGLFIVPEQFTLQAEKAIIEKSKSKVLLNTQVFSFKRLAYRVLSEVGTNNMIPLEDIGKTMVIRKILYNLSLDGNLKYFTQNSYYNIGLLEKINKALQEFFECNISLNDIEDSINLLNVEKNEILIYKLNDLKNIYEKYLDFIKNDYVSNDDILIILSEKLNKSKIITPDTVVWIYGLDGFSNQELKVIYALAEKVKKINICFTFNSKNINIKDISFFDPFYKIKNSIKKINENLIKNNFNVLYLDENKRHKNNDELKFLEKNYFSYEIEKYKKENNAIEIFNTQNKYSEIEKTAEGIIDFVKNNGYKYKDIGVILADDSYESYLKLTFNKYNIPYFLDVKKSIKNNPLVEAICSALDIIIYNWQYEAVFRYLKTGFLEEAENFKIKKNDIDIIENYVLEYGIKGYKWGKEFELGFYEKSVYERDKINIIREKIINSLKELSFKPSRNYKVKEISEKIFNFLLSLNVDKTLDIWKKRDIELFDTEITGNTNILDEHLQVWNSIVEIFEKLVEILGEDEISIEEYSKILNSAFEKETMSILPSTQDQVLIGDFDRTKLSEVKILFCLGMNEGNIPKYTDDSNFISDSEKITLFSGGLELKSISGLQLSTDNLKIYTMLCKPKERLILYYSDGTIQGATKRPSLILSQILKIFPNLVVKKINKLELCENNLYPPKAVFSNLFSYYEEFKDNEYNLKIVKDIYNWFLKDEFYGEKLKHIKYGIDRIKNFKDRTLDEKFLNIIYKDNKLFCSVSKLEEFRKCPFSYFLKYNINVKERQIHSLDYLKLGNLFHIILEEFSYYVFKQKFDWQNYNKDDIANALDKAMEKLEKNIELQNLIKSSEKYKYYIKRIKKITAMTTEAIINQLKSGYFKPEDFEVIFGNLEKDGKAFSSIKIPLENNYEMILEGKIDRVDTLKKDNREYIKIVDYKSSGKTLNIEEVFYGLQLQLLMYLSSFIKVKESISKNEIRPAGAFYFEVKETILADNSEKDILKELNKNYKLRGLVAKEQNILKGIDKKLQDKNEEEIQKLNTSSDITGISSYDFIAEEQLNQLLKLCNILSKETGENIVSGDISVFPYKYKKKTGCDYCEFKSICNFEILEEENKYNLLKSFEKGEIWSKIDEKLGEVKD